MSRLVRFDFAIKYLLRNKVNFDILEGFLSELLHTSITIEIILESESNKNHKEDKYNRVDLLAKTGKNEHIIIEVQCSSQWDYLSRILYGTSRIVTEYLHEGQPYHHIPKVISVSIVFFNLGEGRDYLYRGTTSFKGIHYGDNLSLNPKEQAIYQHLAVMPQAPDVFPEYYLIKISRFHEKVQDKIDEWIYFLKRGEIKKTFVAQGIQSAAKKLDILRLSEEERRAYERYKEASHDEASLTEMLEITEKKGFREGSAEGSAKERIKIAKSLKQAGLSAQQI